MKQFYFILCSKKGKMNKNHLFFSVIFTTIIFLTSYSPDNSAIIDPEPVNDGPYIFLVEDKLIAKWIENSSLKENEITWSNYNEIKNKFNLRNSYNELRNPFFRMPRSRQSYDDVDSIAIISDVHGEYDIYINLLIKNGIIDNNLNWKFGKGHLVILGDVFDRGDKVTEIFWHLFGMEQEAEKAGGRLHLLLGNHELMVLSKATAYINKKYNHVENISGTYYFDLYSENSVLGKWLRAKPVIIQY